MNFIHHPFKEKKLSPEPSVHLTSHITNSYFICKYTVYPRRVDRSYHFGFILTYRVFCNKKQA